MLNRHAAVSAMILLAMLLPVRSLAQSNLLSNPGFESGGTGWQSDETPTFVQNWRAHTGAQAARVTAYYDCCAPWFWYHSVWQAVTASAGTEYVADFWTFLEDFSGEGSVSLEFLNSGGGTLSGGATLTLNDPVQAWTSHTLHATAPAGTAQCRLRLMAIPVYTNVDCAAWLDDASLSVATTGVDDGRSTPSRLTLAPCFPNPASDAVTFRFAVPEAAIYRLRVFDLAGRVVATPGEGAVAPGSHDVRWDRCLRDGRPAPAGVYNVELTAAGERRAGRVLIVR
jgi:hypothetical protein